MNNGKTVFSNHAHLFAHEWHQQANPGKSSLYYEPGVFIDNGGNATLNSYEFQRPLKEMHLYVPKEHIDWLESCPMYIETDDFVFTHAPLHPLLTLKEACDIGTGFHEIPDFYHSAYSLIWNRVVPEYPHKDLDGNINIFGHNSSDMVKIYTTEYPKGIKVDKSNFQEIWKKKGTYPIFCMSCLVRRRSITEDTY